MWQPIESAPKDESGILVYQPARWLNINDDSQVWLSGEIAQVFWGDKEEWWIIPCDSDYPMRLRGVLPTHWMPLPEPPISKAQSASACDVRASTKDGSADTGEGHG